MKLTVGMEVNIYSKWKSGYKSQGLYSIEQVASDKIVFKKAQLGYRESINVIDFRMKLYRLGTVDGKEIKFPPMPNMKKIENEKVEKVKEASSDTLENTSEKSMEIQKSKTAITKAMVQELHDQGKSPQEIVKELSSTSRVVNSLMVRMGLIEKSKGRGTYMREVKITREQLVEECKVHGFSKQAFKAIGAKYGVSNLTIANYVGKWNLRNEITPEVHTEADSQNTETRPADNHVKAPSSVKMERKLKPTGFISQDSDMRYDLGTEELIIINTTEENHKRLAVPWVLLEKFITELQEIQREA